LVNRLYFDDKLKVMRDRIVTEPVDFFYLASSFNWMDYA